MHQIALLTKKSNNYTTIYAIFALVVSVAFFLAGIRGVLRVAATSNIGLDVGCILIGVVFGLMAIWVVWVMRYEIIGLEIDEQGRLNIMRQWGGVRRDVQLISRMFAFGCIRFGAPNDGRLDYVVVRTSDGVIAIPTDLYRHVRYVERQ